MEIQLNNVSLRTVSGFERDTEDSKSILRWKMCIFGSHTFVSASWICKKQTCVSHRSAEPEITSLHAGLRMDGIPALDLWELVVDVLHSNQNSKQKFKKERMNPSDCKASEKRKKQQCNVT